MRYLFASFSFVVLFVFASTASAIPVFGENSGPFDSQAPFEADNESVRILIDPAFRGSEVPVGQPVTFDFITENLTYQPEEATALPVNYANGKRQANAGHFHAYASFLDGTFKETNVFLGANAFTELAEGVFEATMTFPEQGEYLIYVESQYDDHTSRIRPHPQQIGAWDVTTISAVPEPGTLFLFSCGLGLMLVSRRKNSR